MKQAEDLHQELIWPHIFPRSLITDPTDNYSPFQTASTAISVKVERAFTNSTNVFGPQTLSLHKSHQQTSDILLFLPDSSAPANLPALAAENRLNSCFTLSFDFVAGLSLSLETVIPAGYLREIWESPLAGHGSKKNVKKGSAITAVCFHWPLPVFWPT